MLGWLQVSFLYYIGDRYPRHLLCEEQGKEPLLGFVSAVLLVTWAGVGERCWKTLLNKTTSSWSSMWRHKNMKIVPVLRPGMGLVFL